ncbi:hypothetical protein ACET3Z_025258 [Daucus carota]
MYQKQTLPCLHCHPRTYIRMVQHLIEKCLILRMDQDECMKALYRHAGIRPLVTLTVWRELLKENREFFHAYSLKPRTSNHLRRVSRFGRKNYWK